MSILLPPIHQGPMYPGSTHHELQKTCVPSQQLQIWVGVRTTKISLEPTAGIRWVALGIQNTRRSVAPSHIARHNSFGQCHHHSGGPTYIPSYIRRTWCHCSVPTQPPGTGIVPSPQSHSSPVSTMPSPQWPTGPASQPLVPHGMHNCPGIEHCQPASI